MRINQYVAKAMGIGRRQVDKLILSKRVMVNDTYAGLGQIVAPSDKVIVDGKLVQAPKNSVTILMNKPIGYVCSKDGQGAPTIYSLLPKKYHDLKYVGRLDKDSSGLLLLTNDGNLAQSIIHPSSGKTKSYQIKLNKPLSSKDEELIETGQVKLDAKPSVMRITIDTQEPDCAKVVLNEGRNRQIRRTFAKLGYEVIELKRVELGDYTIGQLGDRLYIDV